MPALKTAGAARVADRAAYIAPEAMAGIKRATRVVQIVCSGTADEKVSIVYKQAIAAVSRGDVLMRNAVVTMAENALTKALEFSRHSQEQIAAAVRAPESLACRAELDTPTLNAKPVTAGKTWENSGGFQADVRGRRPAVMPATEATRQRSGCRSSDCAQS